MAFTSTITGTSVWGNKRIAWGTYDGTAVTTGDIDTGLNLVEFIAVQAGQATIVADAPTVNETLPIDGSAVTIIFTSGTAGYWWAFGIGG